MLANSLKKGELMKRGFIQWIFPILKKGESNNPEKFRPISILQALSKFPEVLLKNK